MEILVENFFSDEVVIHFNVFGPNIGLEERERELQYYQSTSMEWREEKPVTP
jgi:hypothetical protein